MTSSTLSGNSAQFGGGLFQDSTKAVTFNGSTISGNTATGTGGGVSETGPVTLTNSTVSGNTSGTRGGGIYAAYALGVLTLNNVTIAGGNSATNGGGGLFLRIGGVAHVENTVIADNTSALSASGPNVSGQISSNSFVFLGTVDGAFNPTVLGAPIKVITNGDPMLGPLADNGGPTLTQIPFAGSPLIDAGLDATGTGRDQRRAATFITIRPVDSAGVPNAQGGDGSDIGAVELQLADIGVTIGESADQLTPPGLETYTVTATNAGPSGADNVRISVPLTLPSGVTLAGVTPSVGTVANNIWTLGVLAGGSSATLTFVLAVDSTATPGVNNIISNATVTGVFSSDAELADPTPGNNTAIQTSTILPPQKPDLTITSSDNPPSVAPGSPPGNPVVYTLNYSNIGNVPSTGVVITETLPTGTTFNAAQSTAGWVVGASTLTFPVGTLSVQGVGSVLFAVNVTSPAAQGLTQLSNVVTIADDTTHGADLNPASNTFTDTTPLILPVDLTVTQIEAGDPVAAGTGTATYTVTVTNNGPITATGVALSDTLTLPTGVTITSITPSTGAAPLVGSTANWSVGNLANGASATLTVVVTAGPTAVSGTDVISNAISNLAANQVLFNTGDDIPATLTTSIISPAPVADAGGPYNVDEAGTVLLDGSATTSTHQDAATLTYAWNLDNDGIFGETG